jgi:membrane protease YdiL (CAAX protease family)
LGTDFPLKTISVLFLAGISEELWLRRLMYTQSAQLFGSAPAVLITALSAATLGLTGNVMVYWLTYVTHLLLTLLFSQTKSLRLAVITNISAKIAYYIFTLTVSRTIISPF